MNGIIEPFIKKAEQKSVNYEFLSRFNRRRYVLIQPLARIQVKQAISMIKEAVDISFLKKKTPDVIHQAF